MYPKVRNGIDHIGLFLAAPQAPFMHPERYPRAMYNITVVNHKDPTKSVHKGALPTVQSAHLVCVGLGSCALACSAQRLGSQVCGRRSLRIVTCTPRTLRGGAMATAATSAACIRARPSCSLAAPHVDGCALMSTLRCVCGGWGGGAAHACTWRMR